mgnify:FL=1
MKSILSFALVLLCSAASATSGYESKRPAPQDRLFTSQAVEQTIVDVCSLLSENPKLAWMFANCFPNTLDTTVHFRYDENGQPDTFVYTGDIHAMWLRDSGAQVWPYVRLCAKDEHLREMIAGVINRQFYSICIDPYANAFNDGPTGGHWMSDNTDMNPNDHERKWEIDSQCYPIRLAYEYWKVTGDTSVFADKWIEGITKILATLKEQQRKEGHGSYTFTRVTDREFDTKCCSGKGQPVKPCGLIASAFRPSDDATTFEFLIPSNFFAVTSLRKAAEILEVVNSRKDLATECLDLADEVEKAIKENAIAFHPEFGEIYAFEVDGFGNKFLMDDANVPSLLAMPYLGDIDVNDPIYQNTRRFVLSEYNPYFFKGSAGEGIGGPHIGYDMIWPMSIMMRAFTTSDPQEIKSCIDMLLSTDAGTGFMHESFHKDDPTNFTREWFAWQNTLFGELILNLIERGYTDILCGNEVLASTPTSPEELCSKVILKDQGIERLAYIYRPEGYEEQTLPLVLVLHGYGGRALDDGLRFIELAKEKGFAVCYPQGAEDPTGHRSWNVGYPFQSEYKIDDVKYLKHLVKYLCKEFSLSDENVFLTGMSNGGEMCYKMASESPRTFSAIASIAGLTLDVMKGTYPHPIPFMEVHGTADQISLWDGDSTGEGGWGAYMAVPTAISRIVCADGCKRYTREVLPSERKRVILHTYSEGKPAFKDGPNCEVLLYEVEGGDHSWSDRYIDTCLNVWNFFEKYLVTLKALQH